MIASIFRGYNLHNYNYIYVNDFADFCGLSLYGAYMHVMIIAKLLIINYRFTDFYVILVVRCNISEGLAFMFSS